MKTELAYYDIFPKVVLSKEPVDITILPLGGHVEFHEGEDYTIRFLPLTESVEPLGEDAYESVVVRPLGGTLRFAHAFSGEQEHYVRVFAADGGTVANLSVYSLLPDLFERIPLRGEFHCHTCRSDGKEAPAVVAANYRKAGYDFLAITDHRKWQPSEEAIQAYEGALIDLTLIHGEEVHAPGNHIHIINFGGSFSVNELAWNDEEAYYREVAAIQQTLAELPEGVSPLEYAMCLWVVGKIREGAGLAIFCHPHWIANVYHVRDAMTRHILANMPFDAFELLGGQTVAENNMQTALYYELRAQGAVIPIVGASDSHGTVNSHWFGWVNTLAFARSDSLQDIISAVKEGYSAAIEQYPGEQPRAHGAYRMVSYSKFLLDHYFPLHDELCFEEGRAMKDYICGDETALDMLKLTKGRTSRLLSRCFGREI